MMVQHGAVVYNLDRIAMFYIGSEPNTIHLVGDNNSVIASMEFAGPEEATTALREILAVYELDNKLITV